jgi:hypothetical protein
MQDVQHLSGVVSRLSYAGLVEGDLPRMFGLLCDMVVEVSVASRAGVLLLDEQGRWRPVTTCCTRDGTETTYGVTMRAGQTAIGRLDLYCTDGSVVTPKDRGVARALADLAASIVHQRRQYEQAHRVAGQLDHALQSRVFIEQAKGALSVHLGLTPDDAFQHLRGYARSRGAPLRVVAQQIVERQLPPEAVLGRNRGSTAGLQVSSAAEAHRR